MTPPAAPLPLHVRQATTDDLDRVVELLHHAYDWLVAQGITDQWPGPFPPQAIQELLRRGEVYVASSGDAVIATFTLSYQPDRELWDDPPDHAGYIRRLVVDREHAGREVGGQLLDHASKLVAAADRLWLRLDCAMHNARLHGYYRAHGFAHLRTIDLPHRQSGALFQRPAALPDVEGHADPAAADTSSRQTGADAGPNAMRLRIYTACS